MVIFTAEGPRSIDPGDILAVYSGDMAGGFTNCVVVLIGGTELGGAISNDALVALEARLADEAPPPMTA